jgi:hypothetical protein
MAFQIKDGRFIARIYYMEISGMAPRGNFLSFLYRDKDVEANEWILYYRMRYYVDNKVHNSNDRRSQPYVYKFEGAFEEVLDKVQALLTTIQYVSGNNPLQEVVVDSDQVKVVSEKMMAQDWASPESPLQRMNFRAGEGVA